MGQNVRELLISYIDALYPIIYIYGADTENAGRLIADLGDNCKMEEFHRDLQVGGCTLREFLSRIMDGQQSEETWVVLKDMHHQLEDPEITSLLKGIAAKQLYDDDYNVTVWIISSQLCIPEELEELVTIVQFPRLDDGGVRKIIAGFMRDLDMEVSEGVISQFALSLKGLNEFQIKQILHLAYQNSGSLDTSDTPLICRQKEQLVRRSGLLEMVKKDKTLEDIGGLESLKEWLYKKEYLFKNLPKAQNNGVAIPKGMVLTGMPGCGKSLAARVTADIFDLHLVRPNMERIFGGRNHKTESEMEKALELLEIMSPCVLWLDEMERFCSGEWGHFFIRFLTQIQEKYIPVFLAATVNDIARIPLELLKKKYFDQWFFVDFPSEEERKRIMEIYLGAKGRGLPGLDIYALVRETEGYSGGDLETLVKDAVENCFIQGRDVLAAKDLYDALPRVKPVSAIWKEEIKRTKDEIKKLDLKTASYIDNKTAVRLWNPCKMVHGCDIKVSPDAVTLYEVLGRDWWKKLGARFVDKTIREEPDRESGSGGSGGYGIGLI